MTQLAQRFGLEARLILVFLLISGGLGYLGYRLGSQVASTERLVQAVGQQRLEIQQLMRSLLEMNLAPAGSRESARAALARDVQTQSSILSALREGGTVPLSPQRTLRIERGSVPEAALGVLGEFEAAWRQFVARIGPVAENARGMDDAKLAAALDYARSAEPTLSALATRLHSELSEDLAQTAALMRTLLFAGVGVILICLALLVWLYSAQLRKVRSAQRETNEILQAVPAGLFLLDSKLKLGEQYSAQLERILQRKKLAGADFFQVLSAMVAGETLVTARDYVTLLLGDRVNEHLVASLNPLDEVEVKVTGESGRPETRWLGFGFKRVLQQGKLVHLLVTVSDVSDRVLLARKLEQIEAASDQQAERLLDLFVNLTHVEPGLLEVRLERWERWLREANEVLKRQAGSQNEFHQLINQVFRPIHALKGEAAAVDLGVIVSRAQAVERELADLRTREMGLSGNDFLPVTVRLEDLFAQFDAVRKVTRRLSEMAETRSQQPAPQASAAAATSWDMAGELCRRAATNLGKRARLELQGLDDKSVPERLRQPLLDVLMQLVRNAIAHGIENPEVRRRAGKSEHGTLSAQWQSLAGGGFELRFRDDGQGIDFDGIRKRAVATGKVSAEAAAALQPRQLAGMIFEPGFSTAELPGDTAGRGVGLDLVRERVRQMGGQIGVSTGAGQYTQFTVRLPPT